MAKYETMLITSTKLDEAAGIALVDKFKALIEANGKIEAVDEWGKRRLAYPINKEDDGIYTLIYFESEQDFPAELERVYNITDGILRTLVVRRPDDAELPKIAKKDSVPEEKAQPAVAEEVAAEPVKEEPAVEEKPEKAEEAQPEKTAADAE